MKKFWDGRATKTECRTICLDGVIADEPWWSGKMTPSAFKSGWMAGFVDATVWINSLGGDCVAAS